MTKLFLKIPSLFRTILMLVCAIGSYALMVSKNDLLEYIGYGVLGLMFVCLYYDRKATKIERELKRNAEKEKEAQAKKNAISVGKYPFEDSKEGYVLKWAYYNENVAGSRYLNVPYKDLKVGTQLELVKDKLNIHDKNAIKVFYGKNHIGYIHKNHIQEMFNKYSEDERFVIETRLNSIDETNARLQLQIGFYQAFNTDSFKINQVIKFVAFSTFDKQEAWKDVCINDYVTVDYNDGGKIYKNGLLIGELKGSDYKKLSNFSRDFRIIYKVGALTGSIEKGNMTGRIDAYVIED